MGVTWTSEQKKVIELRDRNILVSAAAGSGKTAVLVERIITRLTKDEPPLDVDKLLVVTYTEAAAAEMKERIANAIAAALDNSPEDVHLKKQAALIHTAKIMTIHSFCLSVIKEYFHTINLDPGFRIAEEGELKLLKQDVLSQLLEDMFQEARPEFVAFVEAFATGRDDSKLEEVVLQLYEFAGSYPSPEKWLDQCAELYEKGIAEATFTEQVFAYIYNCLQDVGHSLERAEKICEESDGPYMYVKTLESDAEMMEPFLRCKNYSELAVLMEQEIKWARLASKRDDSVDPEKKEMVKRIREEIKGTFADLQKNFFFQSLDEMERDMQLTKGVVYELVNLVKMFQRAFSEKKRERNIIDFRDMEQLALQILTRFDGGKFEPSEAAKAYQKQFEEIMIDEYQDSNLIQETILTSVSGIHHGKNNLFMVGDVKQSIYRFRLSRPELFMEKYDTYSLDDSDKQRVDLHKNFRSREEVLDFTNAIFKQIMTRKMGKIEYDDDAALYVGMEYPWKDGNEAEIIVVDTAVDDDVKETKKELEARVVSERIHELMKTQEVWDAKARVFRPIRYSDIVILTRSLKGWVDVFAPVLNREGIPTYTESREGYFETLEIGWMMNYLRVLNNYHQDIPLTAALKSPFGQFTNEELAMIREEWKDVPFYQAVLMAADKDCENHLCESVKNKLYTFFETTEKIREKIPYTSTSDLLQIIMEETGYKEYVSAMPAGEQRAANVEMLLVKAKAFEHTSYKGLFHFIRYIDQLKKYEVDFGEAGVHGETMDAVRFMSIHKSKGLEFPVVIVAGMGKRFNTQDIRSKVIIHPELGVGIDAVDVEKRTKIPTLLKKLIQTETMLENLGEELRVLYVALTRAREKLILVGSVANANDKLEKYKKDVFSFSKLKGAGDYYQWILPAALRDSGKFPVEIKVVPLEEVVGAEMIREMSDQLQKDLFLKEVEDEKNILAETDEGYAKRMREQFSFVYPHQIKEQLKMKFSVSELKARDAILESVEEQSQEWIEEEEEPAYVPQFMKEQEVPSGAIRGSAYHKILEMLDFSKEYTLDLLEEEMAKMEPQMAKCIWKKDILRLLDGTLGKRLRMASLNGKLHKEQPFVMGVDAKELYPDTKVSEMLMIQGIIDVYFEENEEIVLLDYKTDRVTTSEELVEKYKEQLHLYGRALEQLTGKKVKEKLIYSFALNKTILIGE